MEVLQKWHHAVQSNDPSLLDEIFSEEVVFYSPVVWRPQSGKALTKMYLTAAMHVFKNSEFKYVREIVSGHQACLEFTAKIGETIVNGVDLITINEANQIIEFKVLVRPMQGMMVLK